MGGGVGEAMLIGAAMGGGSAALTGGDPLKGALLGAAGGGVGAGVAGAQAGGAAGASGGASGSAAGGASGAASSATALPSVFQQAHMGSSSLLAPTGQAAGQAGIQAASNPMFPKIAEFAAKNPIAFSAGAGSLGATMGGALTPEMRGRPDKKKYKGPLSQFSYDPSTYTPTMAGGGLADTAVARRMMGGGHLGSYSDGGRLLKGPGDGMSDDIPAKIGKKQPARLADGEFVVPADVVSGLGNGSTDAGAKKLYAMMDKVRHARTGTKKQGKQINSQKYMP
jgi:hypothetical protein